jgi:hypothetical protein
MERYPDACAHFTTSNGCQRHLVTATVRAVPHKTGQEAGADTVAMEGCSLLACFTWLAQPAFL